jgi:hypothetical protein
MQNREKNYNTYMPRNCLATCLGPVQNIGAYAKAPFPLPFVVGFTSPLTLPLAAGFSSLIDTGVSHPDNEY